MRTKSALLFCTALAGGVVLRRALRRPPAPIRGKIVLITGASSGIGRATAHAFAARGAHVVLAARRADLLAEVEGELRRYPATALVVPTDVTRDDDLAHLVSEAQRAFGRIDVLVNNAGVGRAGALVELDARQLHAVLQTNLLGTIRLTQLVLPLMIEQGYGHIVNVSSYAAYVHVPGMGIYSASKAGQVAFSNCLRRELVGAGIYVSSVLPGATRTAMITAAMEAYFSPSGAHQSAALAPLSKVIDDPEAPARAIVEAVQYRRREILLGGPFVAILAALEKLAPGAVDAIFPRMDVQQILSLTSKFGANAR